MTIRDNRKPSPPRAMKVLVSCMVLIGGMMNSLPAEPVVNPSAVATGRHPIHV